MQNVSAAGAVGIQGAPFQPIRIWAFIGACVLVAMIWNLSEWIGAGAAHWVDPGADIPSWETQAWITTLDLFGPILAFWVLWRYAYLPKKATGQFSSDGLLVFAMFTMFWQDPWLVYTTPWFNYNSLHFNLGNWVEFLPGSLAPNTRFVPEPLLTWTTAYVFFMMWGAVFVSACMRKWQQVVPQSGVLSLLAVAWMVGIFMDLVVEGLYLAAGGYAYAGSKSDYALFGGEMWQFPYYEFLFWGMTWSLAGVYRYYRDDRGYLLCERGANNLKVGPRTRSFLRFLSIVGLLQVTMFVTYNVPMQWFGTHGDPWPDGYPSYITNGVCGEGTAFACPAPSIPFPRTSAGMSVDPDLNLNYGQVPERQILLEQVKN